MMLNWYYVFFAYRQDMTGFKDVKSFLDDFLKAANLQFAESLLNDLEGLFERTIKLIYDVFEHRAFWVIRQRENSPSGWGWFRRATKTIYDPLMYVFSQYIDRASDVIERKSVIRRRFREIYRTRNESLKKRSTNLSIINEHRDIFKDLMQDIME